jgi:hypothetical protein
MPKGEWHDISPAERVRIYTYAGGELLRYESVTRVKVSESGTHYLETASGQKAIVAPGWRSVELDMDAWTF